MVERTKKGQLSRIEVEALEGEYDNDGFYILKDGDFYDAEGYYFDKNGFDSQGGRYNE